MIYHFPATHFLVGCFNAILRAQPQPFTNPAFGSFDTLPSLSIQSFGLQIGFPLVFSRYRGHSWQIAILLLYNSLILILVHNWFQLIKRRVDFLHSSVVLYHLLYFGFEVFARHHLFTTIILQMYNIQMLYLYSRKKLFKHSSIYRSLQLIMVPYTILEIV